MENIEITKPINETLKFIEVQKDLKVIGSLFEKDGKIHFEGDATESAKLLFLAMSQIGEKFGEKKRIEGVLLGLAIAKKAWDEGHGRDEIYENEVLYNEELKKL